MSKRDAKPTNQPATIALPHRNGRPMRIGGGPPNRKGYCAEIMNNSAIMPLRVINNKTVRIEHARHVGADLRVRPSN